jgi:hypothetical protein
MGLRARASYLAACLAAGSLALAAASDVASAADAVLSSTGPPPPAGSPDKPLSESELCALDLRRTDRLIAVYRPKVARSGNAGAKEDFAQAVERESEAKSEFALNHFARATRLTLEARSLARSAAVKVGPPQDDPYYVGRTLDRVQDALDLAGDIMDADSDPRSWKRYEALKAQYKTARQAYKDGETRVAYRGAIEVRDGVLQLLRDGRPVPVSESSAGRAISRAEQAVEWAAKEMGRKLNATAQRWQRAALGQMGKARSAYKRGAYRDAVIYSKLVERNLEQAVTAQRSGVKSSA